MDQFLQIFMVAFLLALMFTPVAIKIAPKIGAIDIPKDNRRMHTKAMPRFGGIAIFIGTTAALLLFFPKTPWLTGVIIGGTLMFLTGVVDDLRGLPAKVKLLCQILCAGILFFFDVRISFMTKPFDDGFFYLPWALSLFVTILWVVGITNTINLIDGLDGLAAGVAFIASLAIAYTASLHGRPDVCMALLAVGGGALGFLPFNFNPAKIFMGDAGALFLGFMLAAFSLQSAMKSVTVVATVAPVLVLAIPIFDTAFAILRRIINKRPIMEADKGHLHHRIMAFGLGQKRAVLTLYGISGIMGVAAILISRDLILESSLLVLIAAVFIYVFLTNHTAAERGISPISEKESGAAPVGQELLVKTEQVSEQDIAEGVDAISEKAKKGQELS